jgi:hypothetical protein
MVYPVSFGGCRGGAEMAIQTCIHRWEKRLKPGQSHDKFYPEQLVGGTILIERQKHKFEVCMSPKCNRA